MGVSAVARVLVTPAPEPGSSFFPEQCKGSWTPGQARGDGFGEPSC
jgi:hypothetical protein